METTQKRLESNVVYGLDRVICDYLAPILERELGKAFCDYQLKRQLQAKQDAEATRALGEIKVGQPIELQEELLASGNVDLQVNLAWQTLQTKTEGIWQELSLLYDCADAERCDLERMVIAQQIAEDSGDKTHARRVREIMELEEIRSPSWWSTK